MDPDTPPPPPRSAVAVADRPDPHPVWGDHSNPLGRIEPRFVLVSWLACLALALLIAAVATSVIALLSDTPLTGETNTDLGVLTIVSAMSTFLGFVVMMTYRLVRISHDRLGNSLAVAVLHVAVAALLLIGEAVSQIVFDVGASSTLDGSFGEQLGNAFTVLERSALAAIVGCGLAAGMVPASGDRPHGTQTDVTPQDRQL